MQENENDVEYKRSELTRRLNAGENVIIQSDRAAVLQNVANPKAQYHFVVLPKEDIENVIALKREHLPLLEHMMDLANEAIDKQQLPASDFRIGFKMNAFMNRLNMHVISNDFYSGFMRRIQHWNTFNTDLFITFQAIYALLHVTGSVEPMPADKVEQLLLATPVHCNQCRFCTDNFGKFRHHLALHWMDCEKERLWKMGVGNISQWMGQMQLNGNDRIPCQPPLNPFHRQMIPMQNNPFVHRFQRPFGPQLRPPLQNRNSNNNWPSYRHPAPTKPPTNSLQKPKAQSASNADPDKSPDHQQNDTKPCAKKKWYTKHKNKSNLQTKPETSSSKANAKLT